ncbi:unnamed protein product [Symbiodinium necroappetens]|uniref:Uncharacterized protein n=1 Tax=Symbiodinium necroappetens TaxID=1628268 RepID=A0A812IS63_9DINO|nr:unnamed protein product [Symbiodinium necroappetens]
MVLTLPLSLCSIVLVAADPALFEPDLFTGVQQQLRGPADLDPFGDTVEEDGRSEKWLRDISTRTKNHFKKLLQPLQTPIVQESCRPVNKILLYLNKEMEVVWNLKTIVDRKRWGVGNVITSSPYGPHGEHPERWRANGSFPLPAAAPNNSILLQDKRINLVFHIKPDVEEHENKYAKQLQADYESLVHNINDASQKISDLRARLWKMEDFAKQFIALPSGVWNKIDAN